MEGLWGACLVWVYQQPANWIVYSMFMNLWSGYGIGEEQSDYGFAMMRNVSVLQYQFPRAHILG